MTGYYARPRSPVARIALFLARLGLATFVIAGLAHRFSLMETVDFFWVLGFVGAVVIASLTLSTIAFVRLWQSGTQGGLSAARAVLIALAAAVPFLVSAYWAVIYPPLNDISTDIADPPSFIGLRIAGDVPPTKRFSISPENADRQAEAYPQITGRRYDAAPDRVLKAIGNVVAREGWELRESGQQRPDADEVTIVAIARTLLFGFRCAVAIRVTDEGESSYVDMRSASFYGRHDLGDNARRIEAFFTALDDEMLALAGT